MTLHVWREIDEETDCMEVPGGLIYRCLRVGSMVFVRVGKDNLEKAIDHLEPK